MAAFFRNSVNKVAAQSSPNSFQQNEQALYQALRDNNQQAWDYLMIQVHNQFVVPQSRQSYDYDTLISAYAEGMAIVKDNILTGRFSHEKAKVTTYAYSVCRYTLLTMYDKDKRRQEVSPFAEQATDDANESSGMSDDDKAEWLIQNEVDDHSWALEPLKIAMSSLKDRCQTILQLFYVDDIPDREAARQLGINEANLRQQRRNCVLSLRQAFNQLKKPYL